jgi:hypothetical protein
MVLMLIGQGVDASGDGNAGRGCHNGMLAGEVAGAIGGRLEGRAGS